MKTRKNKGGQKVRYNIKDDWHKKFVKLSQHAEDCGASVLNLLGYINWDDAIYLATHTPSGLSANKILKMINRAYGGNNWEHVHTPERLGQLLNNNEAMVASLDWKGGGHYFAIIKIDGKLQVLDPQSRTRLPIGTYLTRFSKKGYDPFKHLWVINSPAVVDGNNLITRDIIRAVMSEPPETFNSRSENSAEETRHTSTFQPAPPAPKSFFSQPAPPAQHSQSFFPPPAQSFFQPPAQHAQSFFPPPAQHAQSFFQPPAQHAQSFFPPPAQSFFQPPAQHAQSFFQQPQPMEEDGQSSVTRHKGFPLTPFLQNHKGGTKRIRKHKNKKSKRY
jgi:hypothetical protein